MADADKAPAAPAPPPASTVTSSVLGDCREDDNGKHRGWPVLSRYPRVVVGVAVVTLLASGGLAVWALEKSRQVPGRELALALGTQAARSVASAAAGGSSLDELEGGPETLEDALRSLEQAPPVRRVSAQSAARAAKARAAKAGPVAVDEGIDSTLQKLSPAQGSKAAKKRSVVDRLEALLGGDGDEDELARLEEEVLAQKKGKAARRKALDPEEQKVADELDSSHKEFAERLKHEASQKLDFDLKTIKDEFKRDFEKEARPLLCSGCKLVAARLKAELSEHDVHDQESPAQMITAKRKAIDATCGSLRHLEVVRGDTGLRFVAVEAAEEPDHPPPARKLCRALLEESKFDILARLIQRKVPTASLYNSGKLGGDNWERWLCAHRTRLCKRSEVPEDEEEEEEL